MNKAIWKYELRTDDYQKIQMPIETEILTVQVQNDTPCMWALVDPANDKEERFIEIFGTGHLVPCGMGVKRKYISTYKLFDGAGVFHVFERIN